MRALTIDRALARQHAQRYSWEACTRQFLAHLHPFDTGLGEVSVAQASP
jgi:hypothetical protein